MKNLRLLVLLMMGLGPPVWAAGTCTVSNITSTQNANNKVPDSQTVIVTLTCVGDASNGSFPSTTVPLTGFYPSGTTLNAYNLTGYVLYQVGQTPGATTPTANYTVTVKDAKLFPLDLGLLTGNGSASTPQMTAIGNAQTLYPVVRSALTVAITGNSVNSANIVLDLIFRTSGGPLAKTGGPVNLCSLVTLAAASGTASCVNGNITLTQATASLTISAIPSGYKNLVVAYSGSKDTSGANFLAVTFNGVGGTAYRWAQNTTSSGTGLGVAICEIGMLGSSTGNTTGVGNFEIFQYDTSAQFHGVVGNSFETFDPLVGSFGCSFNNTTPTTITSMSFTVVGGTNIGAASTFQIYGTN